MFLDLRHQLVGDRVAIWTKVGGVHRVRIVVVRIRVLNLDDDEAREVWTGPLFVKLVRMLLHNAVVAREFETFAVVGLQIRIGRRLAKAAEVCGKVSVKNDERITRFGMRVETFGQQHMCAEIHRPAPKLRQALALNPDVLDVLRIFRRLDGRNDFVERDGERCSCRHRSGSFSACCRDFPARCSIADLRHDPSAA